MDPVDLKGIIGAYIWPKYIKARFQRTIANQFWNDQLDLELIN